MIGKIMTIILMVNSIFLLPNLSCSAPNEPLLQRGDLVYKGAFRVPKGKYGATTRNASLSYGGSALAYNPVRKSLYLAGLDKMIIEISTPVPVNSTNINSLNTAAVIQPSIDITNGNWNNLKGDGTAVANGGVPGGFLVYDGKLIGSAYASYDGANEARLSHFTASPDWNTTGTQFQGMYRVGVNPANPNSANGGFVGGYMTSVPQEWQSVLGGPALTGMGAISIITRTSSGPCAWVFNPDDVGILAPAPAVMLVGYPPGHTTLGTYGDAPSLYYNRATEVRGVVLPSGTGSVLFFGRHGLGRTGQGDSCYGTGVSDPALHNTYCNSRYPTVRCCYDPVDSSSGSHGYPYVYRVWAYDVTDFADAGNGTKKPWDIIPYAIWNLNFPFAIENAHILGAAYDPATKRIFISQQYGDRPAMEPFPLIHVFEVQPSSTADTTSPTAFIASPANNAKVSGTISVAALAKDNVGVSKVELYVNSTLANDTVSEPYSLSWNTRSVANGNYSLIVKAYDVAGNVGQSSQVTVNVSN